MIREATGDIFVSNMLTTPGDQGFVHGLKRDRKEEKQVRREGKNRANSTSGKYKDAINRNATKGPQDYRRTM